MNLNDYSKCIEKALGQLPKGALLTVEAEGKLNTMTIGWGCFGFEWGLPVFEAMVRESRFTKGLLDKSGEFTVTFPTGEDAAQILAYCGKISGRDADKIKDCSLKISEARKIKTPVVNLKGIAVECRVVAKMPMVKELTDSGILDRCYKNGDLHTMYYGEVIDCYEI